MQNHYSVLGVRKDAAEKEIKKAYRKLIAQFHPDRNGNSAEATTKTQKINEAYEILSNPNSRMKYDLELQQYESAKTQSSSMGNARPAWQYAATSPQWAQNKDDTNVQWVNFLKEVINQLIKHYLKKR